MVFAVRNAPLMEFYHVLGQHQCVLSRPDTFTQCACTIHCVCPLTHSASWTLDYCITITPFTHTHTPHSERTLFGHVCHHKERQDVMCRGPEEAEGAGENQGCKAKRRASTGKK